MATTKAETSHDERASRGGLVYDGFISYSHAADDLLAPRLQAGLQRFAKPWWKRRALRIFRDESSLSANPHLWSSITDALDESGWFVLLLSRDAAESPWVNNEVEYWIEHKDADKIIPVLTDGDFTWLKGDVAGDAFPPALQGAFVDEPRWVDLRFGRTDEQLDLNNPEFSAAVADIASAIRGIPKEELASEEVRQHRRTVRTAWAAGIVVLLLGVAAAVAATVAVGQSSEAQAQRDEAQRQTELAQANEQRAEEQATIAEEQRAEAQQQTRLARSRELAASAINVLEEDPELSVLLASEAARIEQTQQAISVLHTALQQHRTVYAVDWALDRLLFGLMWGSLSPDGRLLAMTGGLDELEVWDVSNPNEPLWSRTVDIPGIWLRFPFFTADGSTVIVGAGWSGFFQGEPTPDPALPYGIYGFDAETGEDALFIPTATCSGQVGAHPRSGPFLDLTEPALLYSYTDNGAGGCMPFPASVGELDWDTGLVSPIPGQTDMSYGFGTLSLSPDDQLFAFGVQNPTLVVNTDTGLIEHQVPGPHGVFSPDGSYLLVGGGNDEPLSLWDVAEQRVVQEYPGRYGGVAFSADGTLVYGARWDGPTQVFDTITGERRFSLVGDDLPFVAQMTPDSTLVAAFGRGARLYDIGSVVQGETGTISLGEDPTRHLSSALDSAGGVAVTWDWNISNNTKRTAIFEPETGSVLWVLDGWGAALSPDGSLAAYVPVLGVEELIDPAGTYQRMGAVQVVDTQTGTVVATMEGLCDWFTGDTAQYVGSDYGPGLQLPGPGCDDEHLVEWVGDLDFSPDGSMLAMGGVVTGSVAVWDAATGTLLWRKDAFDPLASHIIIVAFSPDGTTLAASDGTEIGVFDGSTGEELVRFAAGLATFAEMRFTPDGAMLIAGDSSNLLRIFDTASWEELAPINATEGEGVRDLAISSDGALVATVGARFLRVWSLVDQSMQVEIEVDEPLRGVEFLDDTHLLVLPQSQNAAVIITLDPDELIEVAHARLTRGFIPQECATYGIDPCPTLEEIRSGSA